MKQPWHALLRNDPAYNPNLALGTESFTLSFPPRTQKPWYAERVGSIAVPDGGATRDAIGGALQVAR